MMSRKKARRLALASILVFACVAAAAASILLHRQLHREYASLRERGIAAFHDRDYATAVADLTRYIERHRTDAEAMLCAARARRHAPLPDGRHLVSAMGMYRRYLEMDPGHIGALKEMALLCWQLGYSREAVDAASRVLEREPDDREILRVRASGLAVLRNFAEAINAAERAAAADPNDLEMQVLILRLCAQLGRTSDILPRALAFHDAHPQDPRADLLLGMACMLAEQIPPALVPALASRLDDAHAVTPASPRAEDAAALLIRRAARHTAPEPFFIRTIVAELDRLALPVDAALFLKRVAGVLDEPPLQRDLVRRLFELGWHADLAEYAETLDDNRLASDTDLSGMHAVALAQLNRRDQAVLIAGSLAGRTDDPLAHAWSAVIHAMIEPDRNHLPAVLAAIEQAENGRRASAHLRFFVAEALVRMQEHGRAIQTMRRVADDAPLWPAPRLRLSRLLLQEGQLPQALDNAKAAAGLAPFVPELANLAFVLAAQPRGATVGDGVGLLALLEEIQRLSPGEQTTLSLHVRALVDAGRAGDAREMVQRVLQNEEPQPSEALLLQLAATSRETSLELEEACFARSEALYGRTADWAFARAAHLATSGRIGESIQLLEQSAPPAPNLAWRLSWARHLKEIRDPRAEAAWQALADDPAAQGNLAVQLAALGAAGSDAGPAFHQRTIERVRAITGDNAVTWRIARSRLLAKPGASPEQLNQAATLLQHAVELAPGDAEPRQLLAVVHSQLGQLSAAAEQLNAILQLRPDSTVTLLQLIHIHQERADFELAREMLGHVDATRLRDGQHRRLAELWLRQGEIDAAIAAIEQTDTPSADDRLFRAVLYHRGGRHDDAEKAFDELMRAPTAPIIAAAADFHAARGRPDEAGVILARLFSLDMGIADRELVRARHHAAHGPPQQAEAAYRAALAASPAHPAAWKELIQLLVRSRSTEQATIACAEAFRALPDDPSLKLLHAQPSLLANVSGDADAADLIAAALNESPDSASAIAALHVVAEARRSHWPKAAIAERLRPIADRAPRLVPLQVMLSRCYSASGWHDQAIFTARRAITHNPASPRLAEVAAETFAAAGDWNQAQTAAMRWRRLMRENPVRADLFISRMHLRAGRTSEARELIAPHLRAAIAAPEHHICVRAQQARILIYDGRVDEAAALLWPATQFPHYRRLWCRLAMQMTGRPADGAAWLERIMTVTPASAIDERIQLARSWHALGRQAGQRSHCDRALALLHEWAAQADDPAPLLFVLASLLEEDGRLEEAAALYLRILKSQPDHAAVHNNLAALLLRQNVNADQAAHHALRAVTAKPNVGAFHATLALALTRQQQYDRAIASLRNAMQLEPDALHWRVDLAAVYQQAGLPDQARAALEDLRKLVPGENHLPAELRERVRELRNQMIDGRQETATHGRQR